MQLVLGPAGKQPLLSTQVMGSVWHSMWPCLPRASNVQHNCMALQCIRQQCDEYQQMTQFHAQHTLHTLQHVFAMLRDVQSSTNAMHCCTHCRPQLARGVMQLFSIEQQKSQPLEAHAAAFSTVKVCWPAAAAQSCFTVLPDETTPLQNERSTVAREVSAT